MTLSAVSALTERRREIMREQSWLQREIRSTEKALLHIDAVIRLFDPSFDFSEIIGKKDFDADQIFRPGEAPKLALNYLRSHNGPLATTEIAKYLLQSKGVPQLPPKRFQSLTGKIHAALQTYFRNGAVEKVGLSETRAILWQIK